MPRIGVSITKAFAFRNSTQQFSNVYFYEVTSLPSVSEAGTIIDNLTTMEKSFHSTAVTFVKGRLWSQTGTKATSEMILQKNLSGTGTFSPSGSLDRERAFLFRLRAGVDSRGNPVYLRKWFHADCSFDSSITLSTGMLGNTTGFSGANRTALQE
jgi:hypothetical protein